MSIIVTPTLNATETFQVATPFSYSFTYSELITATDTPAYFFGGNVVTGNSANIKCLSDQNEVIGTGLIYTLSNMSALNTARELEGDVLQCTLPLAATSFSFDAGSYVTFGGPTSLAITGGPLNGHFASFTGAGKFRYGLDDNLGDSLQYIPLAATPGTTGAAASFKIKLIRPANQVASIQCSITNNVMTVTALYSLQSGGGQVTIGMVFPIQGGVGGLTRAFTVVSYLSGTDNVFGGTGTYGVTPNDAGSALTVADIGITTNVVANSGDVLLSNVMTPASGTAQFGIYTAFTYTLSEL
jgi:hypothetical protein